MSPGNKIRTVLIVEGYEALLRARRFWSRLDEETERWCERHRWRVGGKHGVGKTQHGFRRAVRRGQWNVVIQPYLTAAVMNLKRLAAASFWLFMWLRKYWRPELGVIVGLRPNSDPFLSDRPEIGSRFAAA